MSVAHGTGEELVVVVVARVEVMVVTNETEVGEGNLSTSTLGFDVLIVVVGEQAGWFTSTVEAAYWWPPMTVAVVGDIRDSS